MSSALRISTRYGTGMRPRTYLVAGRIAIRIPKWLGAWLGG